MISIISMHENENFAQNNFLGENSMHEDFLGRLFMFMHEKIISMHAFVMRVGS